MDNTTTGIRIKKRRVAKQRRQASLMDRFRGPRGGALVAAVMVAIGAAYGAYGTWEAGRVASGYAGLEIGAAPSDVRYLLGAPPAAQAQGAHWDFSTPSMLMSAGFGADGRLASIACAKPAGATTSLCPPVYGVVPGAGEVDLQAALGAASHIAQVGDTRIYDYDGLGLRFTLAQRQVVAIEHHARAQGNEFARNVIWQLLP